MAIILWGKPKITITKVSSAGSSQVSMDNIVPVADSTQLTTETGDKHTADVEGGGYEAIRYDKNTYTLEFSVRFANGRTMPFQDVSHDGVITGTYKFEVKGQDTGSPKMTINEASVRYEDEMNADDGARRHYYAESIIPSNGGDQITWANTGASS